MKEKKKDKKGGGDWVMRMSMGLMDFALRHRNGMRVPWRVRAHVQIDEEYLLQSTPWLALLGDF